MQWFWRLIDWALQLSGLSTPSGAALFCTGAVAVLIVTWHRKRVQDGKLGVEPSYVILAGLLVTAAGLAWQTFWPPQKVMSSELERSQHSTFAPDQLTLEADNPLKWEDHLGHTYGSRDTAIITHAIQISAKNESKRDIRIEDAFLNSGISGEKVSLKVGTAEGWVPANGFALAFGKTVTFRADFNHPEGIPAQNFFAAWKYMYLSVKVDGTHYHKIIDEKMVYSLFDQFKPNPLDFPLSVAVKKIN
jgi:hypothetical protein